MAEFYDDPATGKTFLRGAAGGGGSEYNGPATDSDIRQHPEAHRAYLDAKAAAKRAEEADEAEEAVAEPEAVDEIEIDEDATKMAAAVDTLIVPPHPDQPADAETKPPSDEAPSK